MSLRMAALGLIARNPGSSGYDLMKTFKGSLANIWPATQSQLYGEMNRLADAGLIEFEETGPRGRKQYRATESGRAVLREWLLAPDNAEMRIPTMLRVFLLSELGTDGARRFLSEVGQRSADLSERLDTMADHIDWSDGLDDRLGYAVLEWGHRLARMQSEWADWAADYVDGGNRRPGRRR